MRGRFKFICEDCNEDNWLTQRERDSRFRPRCSFCGSVFLSPSKGSRATKANKEILSARKDRKELMDKKMNKV